MNRILDFISSSEEAVVSRILVQVHQAVDEHFPAAKETTRKFTKTVFSEGSESTDVTKNLPKILGDEPFKSNETHFADTNDEPTSPNHQSTRDTGAAAEVKFPPPPIMQNPISALPSNNWPSDHQELNSEQEALAPGSESPPSVDGSQTTMTQILTRQSPDWVMWVTFVLLVVGVLLLCYLLLN